MYPRTREYFVSQGKKRNSLPSTTCKACHNKKTHLQHEAKRLKALQYYSQSQVPYCQCCGETTQEFLVFDHIQGGGNKHRQTIGKRDLVYWLHKNNFPPGFRVLCYNCNCSLGFRGYCPHQSSTTTASSEQISRLAS